MRTGQELACVIRESGSNQLLQIAGNRGRLRRRAIQTDAESPRIWMELLEARRMFSAPAHLDLTFGVEGLAMIPGGFTAKALAAGPDGKIYIGGNTPNATGIDLFRINADGSPDTTFGNNGIASCELGLSADADYINIQPDGKIIVGSLYNQTLMDETTSGFMARFNPDGTVDAGFGNKGSVAIIGHDNTYVAGRYIANLVDTMGAATSIGANGQITTVSKDGTSIQLQRFSADGTPDTTFGPAGQRFFAMQSTPNIAGQDIFAATTPDGGFVVDEIYYPLDGPNFSFTPISEFRFNNAGDLISKNSVSLPRGMDHADTATILPDGRVMFYRSGTGLVGADLNSSSPMGLAFGDVEMPYYGYNTIDKPFTIGADGKIYIVGQTADGDGAIQRFNADGSPDLSFSGGQAMGGLGHAGLITSLALADGSVIVAGIAEDSFNGFELFKVLPGGSTGPSDGEASFYIIPGQNGGASGVRSYNGLFGNAPISLFDALNGKRLLQSDAVDA